MNLNDLLQGVGQIYRNGIDAPTTGVSCDTRALMGDEVFVAIPGTKLDGHGFVWDAVCRGAIAVVAEKVVPTPRPVPYIVVDDARRAFAELCDRFHGHPTRRLNVVGVTGTNGKTTTTYLLRSIFEAAGEKVGLIGTVEYSIAGVKQEAHATTPPPDVLQGLFAKMADAECRSAVMEVSSHSLAQSRVHGVHFAAGVFTNLTRDHLDYHQDMRTYLAAKRRLFEMLPAHGVAAINADDAAAEEMRQATPARAVRFGLRRRFDVGVRAPNVTIDGMKFKLRLGEESVDVHTRLIGRHNLYNIAGAAAAAWAMGYDLDVIRAGVEAMHAVPGRLERVDFGEGPVVLVDYAHSDDALRNVLMAVSPLVRGKLILVFGCGGDRDRGKRPKMGRVAEELADLTILTSDNPRSEDPMEIIRQIETGIGDPARYAVEADREQAIAKSIALGREGDVILLCGKGHERTQQFKDVVRPFDDREVAREYLRKSKSI